MQELRAEIALLQVCLKSTESQGREAATPEPTRSTSAAAGGVTPALSSSVSEETPSSPESGRAATSTCTGETVPATSGGGGSTSASSGVVGEGSTLKNGGPLPGIAEVARTPPLPPVPLFAASTSLLAQLPQISRFSGEDLSD